MVRVGDFTVELVRAETKEPFQEHTRPGPEQHVYAEVEPGLDYFIRVQSSRSNVHLHATVDGVSLGYNRYIFSSDDVSYLGSWERTGGICTTTALHFSKARTKRDGEAPCMLTGRVEVEVCELGESSLVHQQPDHAPAELKGDSKVGGKKCVVSTTGTHVLGTKKASQRTYAVGELLQKITLYYCTALGLVANKILDAPPEPAGGGNESQLVTPEKTKARVKIEKRRKTKSKMQSKKKSERQKKRQIPTDEDDDSVTVLPTKKRVIESIDLSGNEVESVDLTGDNE